MVDVSGLNVSQLNELIQQAERRKAEVAVELIKNVKDRVLSLIADEGLTFDQVFGGKKARAKVAAKYRDPSNSANTWAGRGKRPRWFNAALASGVSAESMLAH